MNCAVYRQQFLDVITAKCIQQSSLQQPNSRSAPQSPQRALPNESELTSIKFPKSEYCSPSKNLQVKIRPPLKLRKPENNQITIPVSLKEQKPIISQLSSNSQKYTLSQNIPEAKTTNSKPHNDLKVHAGYSSHATGLILESKTKGMCQIDDETHSEINQSHQKHPTGSDIAKDMATYNQSSADENDKHRDTPNKGTHSEQSITPPCSTPKHKAIPY